MLSECFQFNNVVCLVDSSSFWHLSTKIWHILCHRQPWILLSLPLLSQMIDFPVAGGLLVSSLIFYQNKYKSILSVLFDDPANLYPEKENISIGFYLTAFASAMFFASSFFNIVNIFIDKKATQASVQPSSGPHDK